MFAAIGPSYTDADVFSLAGMEPYSLRDLHTAFVGFSRHVVLFLPRTSDLNEIAALTVSEDNGQGGVHADKPTSVIHYCMYGSSKVIRHPLYVGLDMADDCRLYVSTMAISRLTRQSQTSLTNETVTR